MTKFLMLVLVACLAACGHGDIEHHGQIDVVVKIDPSNLVAFFEDHCAKDMGVPKGTDQVEECANALTAEILEKIFNTAPVKP